jgi:PAS domain S-box-containing protein
MKNIFEKTFDLSPVAMLLVDENSKIQLINKSTELLFNYTKKELIGKSLSLLIPQDKKHNHMSLVKNYFLSPWPRQMGIGKTLFGLRKDQTQFPVEVGLSPIQADGKLFVVSSVIDITKRTKAEQRFRASVNAASHGVLMVNEKGHIKFSNRKIEEIFGYQKGELINKSIEILIPKTPQDTHSIFGKEKKNLPNPMA